MTDYDYTPSFYNSDEVFKKFLGNTSHYRALQDNVIRLTDIINPDEILELGSGTGQTSIRLADAHPNSQITSIDMREQAIQKSKEKIHQDNISFKVAEMVDYVKSQEELPEFTLLLYSFHHIPDPLSKKVSFLQSCYDRMESGSYICIAETFRSETETPLSDTQWKNRAKEAYASTFWNSLEDLSEDEIETARDAAQYSQEHELEVSEKATLRDEEYLVSMDWTTTQATEIGFAVRLAEPVNSQGEGIILLQK